MKTNKITTLESIRQDQLDARAKRAKDSQPTHTPTPWKVTDGTMTSFPDSVYVSGIGRDGFQSIIAMLNDDTGTDHDKRANAAHIVKCVNAHEELLTQLKQMHNHYQGSDMSLINGKMRHSYTCRTCEAIAKAEGK